MEKIPKVKEYFKELINLKEDLEMLKDGTWVPDESSCKASLENITITESKIIEFTKLNVQNAYTKAVVIASPFGNQGLSKLEQELLDKILNNIN